jgi:hypothetical protein
MRSSLAIVGVLCASSAFAQPVWVDANNRPIDAREPTVRANVEACARDAAQAVVRFALSPNRRPGDQGDDVGTRELIECMARQGYRQR